jgi:hypothetical protein
MDFIEDSWWPSAVPGGPFQLPSRSHWLYKEEGDDVLVFPGGTKQGHRLPQSWTPFFFLLDIAQYAYLANSLTSREEHGVIFYKGVLFLDRLRAELLLDKPIEPPYCPLAGKKNLPEAMRRWLFRLLLGLPHDPKNRRLKAELLETEYCKNIFEIGANR